MINRVDRCKKTILIYFNHKFLVINLNLIAKNKIYFNSTKIEKIINKLFLIN